MKTVYYVHLPKIEEIMVLIVNSGKYWETVKDTSYCLQRLQIFDKMDKIGIRVEMAEMEDSVYCVADKFWKKIDYCQMLEDLQLIVTDSINLLNELNYKILEEMG